MDIKQLIEEQREEKILRHCSRCGAEWCVLGKVIEYGKHYPSFIVKKADGTEEEHPADDEIKEAVCRDCAKEIYDLQSLLKFIDTEIERKEEMRIIKKKSIAEMIFGDGKKEKIRMHTNMDVGYNQAIEEDVARLQVIKDNITN